MSNDQGNSSGDGSGGGGDSVDGFSGADEPTVVIVTDEYTRAALGRLGKRLRGAADRCDRLGKLGGEAAAEREADLILEEIRDEMLGAGIEAEGTARAAGRLLGSRRTARIQREEAARRAAERKTRGG